MFSTTIVRVLLVLAASLFLADKAAACTCFGARQKDGFHPSMVYWSSDAVFTGLVTEVSLNPLNVNGKPVRFFEKVVLLSVDEAYRGVQGPTMEIITSSSTAGCGYDFKKGQRYFVYAKREEGKLREWLCGPTVPLEAAARDLAYAREMMRGESGARIVGAVVKYERRNVKDYRAGEPMPGVEVVLEDQEGKRISKTVTNAEGEYEFRGLGVGTYCIRAALPAGLREWSNDGKPKDHCVSLDEGMRHGSDSFILTTDSSITGRLVTPDGALLPHQYLALIPLDENGKEFASPYSPSVNSAPESGSYYFRDVPPGRYLLAVNPRNKPGKSDPAYPLMYYPGVMRREQATVIEVPQSREMRLDDFMLTPPLKERWFSGTVLLADKSPAAGAKVILIDPNDRMTQTNVTEVIADELGRFRVKGYESFPYWIDAYVDSNGIVMWAPPVKLSTSGSVEGVELVISLTYRSQPYH